MFYEFKDINIRHLLILSIGTTDEVHPTIDMIYNDKPNYYYNIYQKSNFKNDMFFQLYPIKYLEYFEKVVGIVEDDYDKKSTLKIERLIKKGFPIIYKTIKNKSVIDDNDISKAIFGVNFNEISDDLLKNFSELELHNKYIILIYLVAIFNKKVKANFGGIIEGVVKNYNNCITVLFNKHSKDLEFEELNDEDIKFYGKSSFTINDFYDDVVQTELNDLYYNNQIITLSKYETFEEQQIKRKKLFENGETKSSLIGFYNGFLKGFGVHEYKLNYNIDENNLKRYNEVINNLYKGNNIFKKYDKIDVVIPTLIIFSLMKELDFLLEKYKTNNDELEQFMLQKKNEEIKLLNDKINEKSKLNEKYITKLEKELNYKEYKDKQKDLEILKLKKEVENLNNVIKDKNKDLVEVSKLREFVFESNKDENEEELIEENEFEVIKNYKGKCVIIGGHVNWVKNLKEKIINENFDFVDFEKIKQIKNINFNQYTHIIINTKYVNHTVYNLILSKINDKSDLYYINNNVNVKYTLSNIKAIIEK